MRSISLFVALMISVAGITGCQKEETRDDATQEVSNKKAQAITVELPKNMYEFVDVEGNSYEAELLENVPLNEYDYTRIIDENGLKYYTDGEGNKVSRLGIDVSEYQPEVDWVKVKDAGAEFVMVRLGFRGYGEAGNMAEDSMFKKHIEGARNAGLDVGVYFFSQAITDEEALEEAEFVLERIKNYEITCPVAYDVEEIKFDESRTDNLDSEQFTRNCKIFCDKVEEAGYETMIYANMKWLAFTLDMEDLTKYEKWYADYEIVPQNPYEISMWQYTETGSIDGVEGNVDLNIWFPEINK